MTRLLVTHAVGGGFGEHSLELVLIRLESRRHPGDLRPVFLIARRPEADVAEHLLDLAARKDLAAREFPPERLRTLAAARLARIPAEQAVRAVTPVVVPLVVGCGEARREGRVVVEVLRSYHARRVDDAPGRLVPVVVGEGLRHRIHAAVTADAVVEEYATVAARAAAYILADAIRRTRRVQHLFHVAAHVIDERETEHRPVGTGDEECLRGGARRHDAGGGIRGQPARAGLRGARQHLLEVETPLERRVMIVVRR